MIPSANNRVPAPVRLAPIVRAPEREAKTTTGEPNKSSLNAGTRPIPFSQCTSTRQSADTLSI
ncbi:unnamed protein product [Ectocarpus sp. 4 AP-2014]